MHNWRKGLGLGEHSQCMRGSTTLEYGAFSGEGLPGWVVKAQMESQSPWHLGGEGGSRRGGGGGKSSQGQNLLHPAVLSMVVAGLRLNGEGRMGETGCQGLIAFKITLCSHKRTLTVENSVGKSSQRENTVCSIVHHAESCNVWCISF